MYINLPTKVFVAAQNAFCHDISLRCQAAAAYLIFVYSVRATHCMYQCRIALPDVT